MNYKVYNFFIIFFKYTLNMSYLFLKPTALCLYCSSDSVDNKKCTVCFSNFSFFNFAGCIWRTLRINQLECIIKLCFQTIFTTYLEYLPGGTSTKTFQHYSQIMKNGTHINDYYTTLNRYLTVQFVIIFISYHEF